MKILRKHYCLIIMAVMLFVSCQKQDKINEYSIQHYDFPQTGNGVEKGLSATYSGIADNNLIMIGGCNFPDTPASEGGEKKFYNTVYLASLSADTLLQWQKIGEIEDPSAYGVAASMLGGVVCVGGTNGKESLSSANIIMFNEDSMNIEIYPLPDLPVKLDNMGGAVMDTMLYVLGGNADGKPSNRVFLLDFTNLQQEWIELPPFPGEPRVQPVCIVMNNENGEKSLYIWGGFAATYNGSEPSLSAGGYIYSFRKGDWRELPSPKIGEEEIFLGGGAVTSVNDTLAIFTGGVNGEIFLKALQREAMLKEAILKNDTAAQNRLSAESKEYMLQPCEWYKFNSRILVYNSAKNNWSELVVTTSTARAGASLLYHKGTLYSVGGELKPGVRSSEVVAVKIH